MTEQLNNHLNAKLKAVDYMMQPETTSGFEEVFKRK